jgi:hypothetical protein
LVHSSSFVVISVSGFPHYFVLLLTSLHTKYKHNEQTMATAVGSVVIAAAQSVAKVYVIGAVGWLAVKRTYFTLL